MNSKQKRDAARAFARDWEGRGNERGESQVFWLTLLHKVFGIEEPEKWIRFEEKVQLNHVSFIDAVIPSTRVMIEQKSLGKDLRAPIRQSDGTLLSPIAQAKRYFLELPVSQHPRWIVTCNFAEFHIYDMERPQDDPAVVRLCDLEQDYSRLEFLVRDEAFVFNRQKDVSLKAGQLVGRLYDLIHQQYANKDAESTYVALNRLCVRLVFCLYAEDAGIFSNNAIARYLSGYRSNPSAARRALIDLFETLNTPPDRRSRYIDPMLAAFPYVNGLLFAADDCEVPFLTSEILDLLIDKASLGFDWSDISPTIFGSVFESTLNPTTRRTGGMHYTSVENIHRVIDPLFLNSLRSEFNRIVDSSTPGQRRDKLLRAFIERLAGLRFFDPACGSGNFLTETYLSLRRLENDVLRLMSRSGGPALGLGEELSPISVKISQFYGLEINDFAVSVAKTALWIAESQMMKETSDIVAADLDFLPLKAYNNIVEANSLTYDWSELIAPADVNFIIGNPPFFGARMMTATQKADIEGAFGPKWHGVGNLDYVAAWFKKSADFMAGTQIRAALVSTNSITQGEQAAILWPPLLREGVHINFAYRTFRWDSESENKAHVHCVIIGFSYVNNIGDKRLYNADGSTDLAANISPYLFDGPDVVVGSRSKPLCNVPEMGIGCQPVDGGNYLFTAEEMREFIKREPVSEKYFRPWYGAVEFINRRPRYCLWLGDCPLNELRHMPRCMERVQNVCNLRLASKRAATRKIAETPTRFLVENMPKGNYLLIPSTSSENREYIPMGFMSPDDMSSDAVLIIPDATLFHFGVLTSSVHMAWMRLTAGRLKSDYRYSKGIVYNNFPWPEESERISETAQAILDAREAEPDCSLADLYDPLVMPASLRKAHRLNDAVVLAAYGLAAGAGEAEIQSHLLSLVAEQ